MCPAVRCNAELVDWHRAEDLEDWTSTLEIIE
jgi:hypothetical protein